MMTAWSSAGRAGSSPRVRGTHKARHAGRPHQRFIPACAGNTSPVRRVIMQQPVHPRVCGEHVRCPRRRPVAHGSSPRVRGTLSGADRAVEECRFIPACAGNTLPSARCRGCAAVHPRVCGEHIPRRSRVRSPPGSSPRVRGTRRCRRAAADHRRFIPACAGNTVPTPVQIEAKPVHPRVCGEHRPRPYTPRSRFGSSPRVRGTHKDQEASSEKGRFIPACAGNTRVGNLPHPY